MAEPRIVYTPLKRKAEVEAKDSASKMPKDDPFIRAENEDDDGYDPYSDRREEPKLFEKDPWQ